MARLDTFNRIGPCPARQEKSTNILNLCVCQLPHIVHCLLWISDYFTLRLLISQCVRALRVHCTIFAEPENVRINMNAFRYLNEFFFDLRAISHLRRVIAYQSSQPAERDLHIGRLPCHCTDVIEVLRTKQVLVFVSFVFVVWMVQSTACASLSEIFQFYCDAAIFANFGFRSTIGLTLNFVNIVINRKKMLWENDCIFKIKFNRIHCKRNLAIQQFTA